MPPVKATVGMVSRPLPRPGHSSASPTRISCTYGGVPDGEGCAMALEVSEHTEPMVYDTSSAAENQDGESSGWTKDEIDAISALFDRPMRHKPALFARPTRQRPANKTRLPIAPTTPKRHVRLAARAAPLGDKGPEALLGIAREIAALPPERDVAAVLDPWARLLRKGSLSTTVRELGHMGLPERALQTLCWAQRQPLFPDDRVLASAIHVLARFDRLRVEHALDQCVPSASRLVLQAMARGFLRAGEVGLTRRLLDLARVNGRTLDSSVYVRLMLEAAKTRDGYGLAAALVDELGDRPDLDLRPQDCTAVMKVCVKLRRYAAVESLFRWFRESSRGGSPPTVVMYTTVIHSRCRHGSHREALALVWEMERAGCLLDLPAYRVIVKLCVALGDPERALRYLSRMKDAGFLPTADMYDNLIRGCEAAGRLAKCRQLVREAQSAGLKLHSTPLHRRSGDDYRVHCNDLSQVLSTNDFL